MDVTVYYCHRARKELGEIPPIEEYFARIKHYISFYDPCRLLGTMRLEEFKDKLSEEQVRLLTSRHELVLLDTRGLAEIIREKFSISIEDKDYIVLRISK